jgi:WD40 repeat protein/serine/threonine protein kinase
MTSPPDQGVPSDDLPTRHQPVSEEILTRVDAAAQPLLAATGIYVPDADTTKLVSRPASPRRTWPRVEGYEILDVLGQGAMGVVYKARQSGLKRLVALKVILSGAHASDADLARFRTEAEAAARLQHPNIVQVHDIGEWHPESGGRSLPYLALEYVEGGSLATYMKGAPQPPRFAAELIRALAEAMQYAHDRQVVHRDLKPGNILLKTIGAASLASGMGSQSTLLASGSVGGAVIGDFRVVPKIADFGLAKQLDDLSHVTVSGAIVGTPSYMAPEQASGQGTEVAPAVDVYALGAILYEMLTGRPAFRGTNVYETLDQVRNAEPVPPRSLQSKVPADLETICLKCLRKDAGRRYKSAFALAEDLRRFLTNEPIRARPVSRGERIWRWCSRNPGAAMLIGGIAFSLLAGSVVSTYFGFQAMEGEKRAKASEKIALERKAESDQRRYVAAYREASMKWKDGYIGEVKRILKDLEPVQADDVDLRSFEWHYLQRLCRLDLRTVEAHEENVFQVTCSPDGRWLATAGGDKTIVEAGVQKQPGSARIWERATGRLVHTFAIPERVLRVAFSPDSQLLAWAGFDKIVRIVDVVTGAERCSLPGHTGMVRSLVFRPDGAELASGSADKSVRLWNLATRQARVLSDHAGAHTGVGLAYSADGRTLYSAGREAGIVVWDVATGERRETLAGYDGKTTQVAISGDGRRLASYGQDQLLRIWDTANSKQVALLHPSSELVHSIALSSDGKRVATCGEDRIVRVWNADTGKLSLALRGHEAMVFGVSFSPEGWEVLSACADGRIKIWDAAEPQEQRRLRASAKVALGVTFLNGGSQLASCESGGTIRLWDAETGMHLKTLSGHRGTVNSVCWLPKLKRLASAGDDGLVRFWDVESGMEAFQLSGANQPLHLGSGSPDGRWFAAYARDGTVFAWDLASRSLVHRLATKADQIPRGLSFHPNGLYLAAANDKQPIQVWNLETGEAVALVEEDKETPACCVAFGPNGKQLVTGGDVGLWDLESGKKRKAMRQDIYSRMGIIFTPDGRRVAAVAPDPLVRIWDVATGQELLALPGHTGRGRGIAISRDGLCLATVAEDGLLQIWDARPLSFDRLETREAVSLVRFLAARFPEKDEMLRRISEQAGITEGVRQRARELVREARFEPEAVK